MKVWFPECQAGPVQYPMPISCIPQDAITYTLLGTATTLYYFGVNENTGAVYVKNAITGGSETSYLVSDVRESLMAAQGCTLQV